MTKEEILNLSIETTRKLFRDFLDTQNLEESTKSTRMNDAFYLVKHNPNIDFFAIIISDNFEEVAQNHLYNTLKKNSKGDINRNLNSYMSHFRSLRNFLLGNEKIKKQNKKSYFKPVQNSYSYFEIEEAISEIKKYHNSINNNYTRYKSWEHCYNAFKNYRKDKNKLEYLCLHLAWYLASWGMLRNSGLMNYDYFVHKEFIEKISNSRYDELYNQDKFPNIDLIFEVVDIIKQSYPASISKTETLLTKIILGVFGCVPAYDRYFKDGLKKSKICYSTFSKKSIYQLYKFYQDNLIEFELLNNEFKKDGITYTPMKLIDMCFWQYGYDASKKEK